MSCGRNPTSEITARIPDETGRARNSVEFRFNDEGTSNADEQRIHSAAESRHCAVRRGER